MVLKQKKQKGDTMDSIITTNLKEITLSSQFLTLTTPNGDIEIDIKQLLKEPVNSDNAYFNATEIAKLYGKRINDFIRLENTQEYLVIMGKYLNTVSNGNKIELVKTVRGKHHSGTWLHAKVVLRLIRWLDTELEVAMDLFIQNLIVHSNQLKIERSNTKIHFKPLTDVIKEIYIPAQSSDNAKKYAYQNIATLINLKALGMSGTKYRKDNNIDDEVDLRDVLSQDMLNRIDQVELDLHGYIKYANITDYEILRSKLEV